MITCYIAQQLQASIAQSVERRSRKAQATSSILVAGSRIGKGLVMIAITSPFLVYP